MFWEEGCAVCEGVGDSTLVGDGTPSISEGVETDALSVLVVSGINVVMAKRGG